MPDPKLIIAMEEIKAVLKKHDIAAIVHLGSPSHCEFLYHLSPSWSCATLTEGGELRIRALRSEYPSLEAQKECVTNTTGMFAGFRDLARQAVGHMNEVLHVLGRHFDISYVRRFEPPEG